jgi:hypothetical protein
MELVFDGEAWSAIGPDPDWGNTFLPLSAGSGKALTGDLHFQDFFGVRFSGRSPSGNPAQIVADSSGSFRFFDPVAGAFVLQFDDLGNANFYSKVECSALDIQGDVCITAGRNAYFALLEATATATFLDQILGRGSRPAIGRHAEFGGSAAGNAGIIGFARGSDGNIGADIGFLASENETDELRFSAFGSNISRMSWWTRTTGAVTREVMRLHHSGGLSLGSTTDPGAGRFTAASGIGFHGVAAPTSRPAVTGSRGGNAALQSLLAALHACGIVNDTTT